MADGDTGRKQQTGVDWMWDDQSGRWVPRDPEVRDIYNRGGLRATGKVGPGDTGGGLGEQYPDTWGTLMEQFKKGGGPDTLWQNILANYRGGQDLTDFMKFASPFMAASLFQSKPYQALQDFENLDKTLSQYGSFAGQIEQGAQRGVEAGSQALGRAGLSRSGAIAGLAAGAAQQAGGQRADLKSRLTQQHYMNRANFAQRALDNQRQITQLALGMQPAPRDGGEQFDWGGLAMTAGSAIGSIAFPYLSPLFQAGNQMGQQKLQESRMRDAYRDNPYYAP